MRVPHTITTVLTLALLLLVTRTVPAQGPNAGVAAGLVQRAAATHGNKWTSGELADWVAAGKLTFFTSQGPKATFDVTVQHKGSLQLQRIIKQPGGTLKKGTDGATSWESIPGFFTPAAQGRALQFIESQTTRSMQRLFNHQREGLTLRDQGSTNKAHTIEAEDEHGKKTSYTIDDDTAVVTKLEFVAGQLKDPFSGKPVPDVDTYVFSDYQVVQGVLTAFKIERFNNGNKTEEMQFTSVKYNAGLKDQDFKR